MSTVYSRVPGAGEGWIWKTVCAAAEVAASYMDLGAIFIPALLIMMVAKFFIVVSYFMHLKFDHKLFSWLFYAGLFLAVGVYIGALSTFHFFGK